MKRKPKRSVLAWHFVAANHKLRDGQAVKVGKSYALPPGEAPELCARGYHASVRALDALYYAPGSVVCRVRLSGKILHDTDKLVATRRTVLAMADATRVLHEFACDEAERVLLAEREAGREPDARSWNAIAVKRRWLTGEATDAELSAAWSAARSAAQSAARSAANKRLVQRLNRLLRRSDK